MNGEGWIKLYRKIEDSDIWALPPLTRNIWFWILLHTNHEDRTWMGVVVPRGELITSYRSIAEGVAWGSGKNKVVPSIKTIRCVIHKLIQIGNLGHGSGQAPGQGGLWLKVLHWEDYQDKPKTKRAGFGAGSGADLGQGQGIKQEVKKERSKEEEGELTLPSPNGHRPLNTRQVVDLFHQLCPSLRQVNLTLSGEARKEKFRMLSRHLPEEQLGDYFRRVEASDFLTGRKVSRDHPGWQADLDFIATPSKIALVLEGKYDNTQPGVGAGAADSYDREMELWKRRST